MNQNISMNQSGGANRPVWLACVDAQAAARFLGWPPYFMPLLARAGT